MLYIRDRGYLCTSSYVLILMKKIHLNLSVDEDLVIKARTHGLVISKFLENKLQEYFNFIDAVSSHKNQSKN